jgi:pimeloyl-ACP methyl ester carboxylesterase
MPSLRANRQLIRINSAAGRFWDIGDTSAPTAVLLASPLARGQAYLRTAYAIAARAMRLILIEMPGSGGGTRLDTPWTYDNYAQWVAALLHRLALQDVTLIGHSNSGATALITAANFPQRIANLILVDSTGARPLSSIPRVIWNHAPEFLFEYWFNWRAGPDVFYNMLVHPRNFWTQVRAAVHDVVIDRAPRVQAPTLIAWGKHDRTVPPDCADLLAQAIPDATIYWSPEGRHDWIIEHPDEFADIARRFQLTSPSRPPTFPQS